MSAKLNALNAALRAQAQQQDGFLPFEAFMNAALYIPNLGYYASTEPIGSASQGGDFITAPQISSLFGATLAQALAPVFEAGLPVHILECGAGTGKLASDIIARLKQLGFTHIRYSILELSTRLRAQQQSTLQSFSEVDWLDALPASFEGVVLGNELLDAMPVQAYELNSSQGKPSVRERGVVWQPAADAQAEHEGNWLWASRPIEASKEQALLALLPPETAQQAAHQFEHCTQASAWVSSAAEMLKRGIILLIDYGFPQAELYHPQRAGGTLMAHRNHQASSDVLAHVGTADITAHVNFSSAARAGQAAGLNLLGYTSQARFLINAGIAQAFEAASHSANATEQAKLSQGLQYLISEAEMGELFKVVALGKQCAMPLGFDRGDRSHRLHDGA